MNNLRQELKSYIIDNFLFGVDEGLKDDTSLLEQGILDSTGVMELVEYLEAIHDIKIEDYELLPENLDSINSICKFIESKNLATSKGN